MGLGWKELLILLVVVVLIFGTRKLANLGKDLGSAVGGFKKGLKEGEDAARLGQDEPTAKVPDAEKAPGAPRDGQG